MDYPPDITLSLPYPTSANKLWRAVKGRNIKSAEYRLWEAKALVAVAQQRPGRVYGAYIIHIEAIRPDIRRRDVANLEKACSDLLVTAGIIEDDCLANKLIIEWASSEPSKDACVHIEIWKAS